MRTTKQDRLIAIGLLTAFGSAGSTVMGFFLASDIMKWMGVVGMGVFALVTGIASWSSGRGKPPFGTESFHVDNVTQLPGTAGIGEAYYGTESDPMSEESEQGLARTES